MGNMSFYCEHIDLHDGCGLAHVCNIIYVAMWQFNRYPHPRKKEHS